MSHCITNKNHSIFSVAEVLKLLSSGDLFHIFKKMFLVRLLCLTSSVRRRGPAVAREPGRVAGSRGAFHLQDIQHRVDGHGVVTEQQTGSHHLQRDGGAALRRPQSDGRAAEPRLAAEGLGVRPERHGKAQPGTSGLRPPEHREENSQPVCARSVC